MEYKSLYKISTNKYVERQEQRRKILLNEQKLQREKIQDQDRISLQEFVSKSKVHRGHKEKLSLKDKYNIPHTLQLSEWLREKPENLEKWYLVSCPKGQRCFVIACNGITEAYNKAGKRMFYFHSSLPGDGVLRNEITILDCIYCKILKKFFVLDAVALANHDLCHCEASFRRYWIKSRFNDNSNYESFETNNYEFVLLDWIDFEDEESIRMQLMKYPYHEDNIPELDGFLFYHKEASYTFGSTPLVGWLFSFMITEVLGYDINENFRKDKPDSYVDYLHFINIFEEELAKKRCKGQRKGFSKMDEHEEDEDAVVSMTEDYK